MKILFTIFVHIFIVAVGVFIFKEEPSFYESGILMMVTYLFMWFDED